MNLGRGIPRPTATATAPAAASAATTAGPVSFLYAPTLLVTTLLVTTLMTPTLIASASGMLSSTSSSAGLYSNLMATTSPSTPSATVSTLL